MSLQLDLFAEPERLTTTTPAPAPPKKRSGRRGVQPCGYARAPGTGPKGETCRTCAHACRVSCYANIFYKCACARPTWTHGKGTDIRLKSPACMLWTQRYVQESA